MTRWLLRRIAVSIALAWIVATLVFLALHMVPGDPAELLLAAGNVAPDPAAVAELHQKLGLDRPLLDQYLSFLVRLAHGDLGNSLVDDYPVTREIALRLPRTLELIVAGALLAVLLGIPAGTLRCGLSRRVRSHRVRHDGASCLPSRCSCSARC